jgi:hypothetical protein
MGIVIPFERRRESLPSKKKRSSESILLDYAHTMIAFRSVFLEDQKFDSGSFCPRDVIRVIDPALGLTDSQERRLARHVKAIHDGSWYCSKLEAIRDAWRLYDEDAPPPSGRAIIAAFRLVGARNEHGIVKLIEDAKRDRAAYLAAQRAARESDESG